LEGTHETVQSMPNRALFSIVCDMAQQIRSRPPDPGVP
jgi:hypothetical protein